MARWDDIAPWRGPTVNEGDGDGRANESEDRMYEYNGQITHIATGYFEGTISWQRNADANVSSHFVFGREPGQAAQMVDTDIRAWTQGSGNGRWISIENAGFPLGHKLWKPGWERLTPYQIEMNARVFAKGHLVYGWPLQLTNHPNRDGLGYHGMGAENGFSWGHLYCPGEPIKAQLPEILARAIEIVNGDDDMPTFFTEHGEANAKALAWAVEGVANLRDTIADGPNVGEPIPLTAAVKALAADVAELKTRPPVQPAPVDPAMLKAALLDPGFLAAIAKAVNDDDHRRSAE